MASGNYTFPAAINPPPTITKFQWNYSVTGINTTISTTNIALTGTPIFLMDNMQFLNLHDDSIIINPSSKKFQIDVFPNPTSNEAFVQFQLASPSLVRITISDGGGKFLGRIIHNQRFSTGSHKVPISDIHSFPSGVYYIRFETEVLSEIRKLVIVK